MSKGRFKAFSRKTVSGFVTFSRISEAAGARLERSFSCPDEERLYPDFALLANAFGRDDAEREELRHVIWMVVYSLGLAFLEQRALFGKPTASADLLSHAEWVVGAAERLLRERSTSRGG